MLGQVEIQWKAGGREGSLQVQAVYSARKTMGLEVKPDGRIYARFPRRTPDKTARTFIREHSLMMEQRREKTQMRPRRDYEENSALERIYRKRAKERLL